MKGVVLRKAFVVLVVGVLSACGGDSNGSGFALDGGMMADSGIKLGIRIPEYPSSELYEASSVSEKQPWDWDPSDDKMDCYLRDYYAFRGDLPGDGSFRSAFFSNEGNAVIVRSDRGDISDPIRLRVYWPHYVPDPENSESIESVESVFGPSNEARTKWSSSSSVVSFVREEAGCSYKYVLITELEFTEDGALMTHHRSYKVTTPGGVNSCPVLPNGQCRMNGVIRLRYRGLFGGDLGKIHGDR